VTAPIGWNAPLRSERGRLVGPELDDRRWQDIVDEASTLIDRYAPQWTDRNPSDVGITLVELFAWLVESLIYRLNRVPEKNFVAFLNLIGVTRTPPQPSRTLLTLTATRGPVELPPGTPAQTMGGETFAPIVFETDVPVTILPARVDTAVTVLTSGAAGDPPDPAADLTGPRPAGVDVDLGPHQGLAVCLPLVVEQSPPPAVDLWVEPVRPPVDRQAGERVEWVCSSDTAAAPDPLAHDDWAGFANRWSAWRPLEILSDGTAGLIRPGVVRLRVPDGTTWSAHDPKTWTVPLPPGVTGPHHWLALRVTNDPSRAPTPAEPTPGTPPANPPPEPHLTLRLARMQINTASAVSVHTVAGEDVGPATGAARLVRRLAHGPVHVAPGAAGPDVAVEVAGKPWTRVDWFPDGSGEVYLLDPVTAELTFGDHDPVTGRGRGSVPPQNAAITVTYRHVSAGANGNVPAGAITVLAASGNRLPGGGTLTGVSNPVAATGGSDEEPVEDTIRRVPDMLRDRGRAVTVDDYERIARTAAPGIATVRALPPRLLEGPNPAAGDPWTFGGLHRAPGTVTVIVVPDLGADVPEPAPSLALVHDVLRALDVARPAATALRVAGPRYVRVAVTATVQVFDAAVAAGRVRSKADECARLAAEVRAFLHPVHGGRNGTGWQVGDSVFVTDLYPVLRPPDDVGFVTSLTLGLEAAVYPGAGPNPPRPPGLAAASGANQVRLADYELVCAGTITVTPAQ
jgi:predicted phage baseplate assembly protein